VSGGAGLFVQSVEPDSVAVEMAGQAGQVQDSGLLAYRLRNSWVMPATTAVASTQPKTIMSQV
jgi:hypothetical protein